MTKNKILMESALGGQPPPIPVGAPAPRRLDSWIGSFVRHTEPLHSPHIFRRWTAIGMLSAVLERRVWIFTRGKNFYPNQYIFLIGPPGSGKGNILSHAKMILAEMDLFLSSTSVSKASLIDELNEAARKLVNINKTPEFVEYNFLNIILTELGAFISAYESDFIDTLTDIYDGVPFGDRKRTKGTKIKMISPQMNIVAGTTPAALHKKLPENAWDEGFMSRVICIYSGEKLITDPFADSFAEMEAIRLGNAITEDLKSISKLFGKIEFDPKAAELITNWNAIGCPPLPEHPKLINYTTRRLGHLLKLCIIASVSRSSEMIIREEDYQDALSWLLEAEHYMPDIFVNMGIGGDSKAIDDAWFFVYSTYTKTKTPIFETRLYEFLRQRVPSHNVARVVEVMVRSGMLRVEPVRGLQAYVPAEKVRT